MIRNHIIRVIIGVVLGIVAGTAYYFSVPRVYEGSTEIFVNTQQNLSGPDVTALLALGLQQSVASEVGVLQSRGTFRRALEEVSARLGTDSLMLQEEELYKMYNVQAARDSRFVRIVVNAYSPEVASEVANEITEVYIALRRNAGEQSYASATQFLEEQVQSTEKSLQTAEDTLKKFKEDNGIVDLGSTQGNTAGYLATLTQSLDDARAQAAALQREIRQQEAQIAALPESVATSVTEVKSPLVQSLENQIAEYETRRTELLRTFTEDSVRVKEVDNLIAQTRRRYEQALQSQWATSGRVFTRDPVRATLEQSLASNRGRLVSTQSRISSVNRALAEQSRIARQLPEKEQKLTQLTLDRDVFRDKFVRLKTQLEDIRLRSNSAVAQALVLYPAFAQRTPISPIASRVIPVWVLAGACIALVVSLVRESLRSTVRGSTELSGVLELPVVGTAPMLSPRDARKRLRSANTDRFLPFESFRFMASVLALNGGNRRVLFTSVGGSVGCSSSAIDFSISAARMGVKTVLIDGDLKFGTVTKAFELSEKSGLRDIFSHNLLPSGSVSLAMGTVHDHLTVVPVGSEGGARLADVPPAQLAGILDTLQEASSLVVIDCPPFDVLADAARFVPFVDEVCLVVSAGKTNLQAMAVTRDLLFRAGAKNVSLVMTGTAPDEEPFTRRSRYLIEPRPAGRTGR